MPFEAFGLPDSEVLNFSLALADFGRNYDAQARTNKKAAHKAAFSILRTLDRVQFSVHNG